jgi:Protein of unknown function (DUF998)
MIVRFGLGCGVFAPLWWAGMIVYCAARFPGYSHVTDFISELAAHGSPTEGLMRDLGFIFTGGLYLAFAGALGWHFRRERLAWLAAIVLALAGAARIGAGIYQCEIGCASDAISASQIWHYRYAAGGYCLMMAAAVLWGFVANRYPSLQRLLALGIGTATWSAVSLVMLELHPAWQGVFQRFASGILSLWTLIFAVSVWRARALPLVEATPAPPVIVPEKQGVRAARRRAARRRARKLNG